jgi:hypothetical protein
VDLDTSGRRGQWSATLDGTPSTPHVRLPASVSLEIATP